MHKHRQLCNVSINLEEGYLFQTHVKEVFT